MTIKVSLPEEFSSFVEAQVASGQYATPDDVVRDALRLMEAEAENVARLRRAYQEGLDSGFIDGPPDFEAIKAEGRIRREKSAR